MMPAAEFSAAGLCKPSATAISPRARFVFRQGRELWLNEIGELPSEVDCRKAGLPLDEPYRVAEVGELDFLCVRPFDLPELPANWKKAIVRAYLHSMAPPLRRAITRAMEMTTWRQEHRFCGKCGAAMLLNQQDGALKCIQCGFESFPILSPAIIVRITRNNHEILLGRSAFFATPCFSNFSGFVESGETLEEAVQREIQEEIGITIRNLRYFGSQNWPFPHTLLAAFTADYASGELQPDGEEIVEARWFDIRSPLPELPQPGSISRQLIDDFCAGK